jgi:hypothetical protein
LISDALLEELRKRAADRKKPFRVILEQTIQLGLAAADAKPRKIRIKAYPAGIKAACRGMSLNQLYDQLEAERTLKAAES